jgi:predicted AlkP superfamily phosphohydrolase/phosphomutase
MHRTKTAAISLLLLTCAVICACHRSETRGKKVIVLGVDGMDPAFLERHWNELPNVRRLRDSGGFRRLGTTTPPQSPVAWSTFITGLDPSGHGIFDFVHRDPATLQLYSSMSRTVEPRFKIPLGPYILPLSSAQVQTLRKGQPFWQILSKQHIPVDVVHMPTNFPPVEAGLALAGMGTPDLRGTQGTFTFYTDDPEEITRDVPGGRIVKVGPQGSSFRLPVEGPPNSLRKDRSYVTQDLIVDVDPDQSVARLSIGGSLAIVKQGEWSQWLRADFPLLGWLAHASGMFRVYAKELHPRLALYTTPVNIDPRSPDLPISVPSSYSRAVARDIGPFYTQGIAEDTAAFRQGVLTMPEFLEQATLVGNDELKLLRYSLDRFREGLLFFYFSSIDQSSHMLWGKHEPELLDVYRNVDAAIGEVTTRFPDADIIVMSDHGFNSFDRAVNLNTWLWQHGFLALRGAAGHDDEGFGNVDWSKTQAYALGLNGLYLNIAGREEHGIVKRGPEADAIARRLREELVHLIDPENSKQVVETVPPSGTELGPDMIVGYARGYRGSWQTALGAVPESVLEDNTDAWIGDHCINAADVPGVLLSNRTIQVEHPTLKDLTVTTLGLFGAAPGAGMDGKTVF